MGTIKKSNSTGESKRRQTEETLRKLSRAVEQSPSTIVITDLDGNIEYVNPKFTQITGYTLEEVIGQNPRILKSNEHPTKFYKELWKKITAGKEWRGEFYNQKKNGEFYWEHATISSITDKKGVITHFLKVAEDITERKRAEQALRDSEERYHDLFENANDLIQSVTPEGRFGYVNRAWRETLGYSEEEIAELTLFDIIHPDSQTHCKEVFQRVISGEKIDNIEAVFVAKDGKEVIVEGSANCRFEEGRPVSTRGIFRDVTERKKIEQTLVESEEKYRRMFELSPEAVVLLDIGGRLLDVNERIHDRLGYKPQEVVGKHVLELPFLPEESKARVKKELSRKMPAKDTPPYELDFITKDGEKRIGWVIVTLIKDADGKPIGILVMVSDITERKRVEEALRRSIRRNDALLEAIPDMMFVFTRDGVIVDFKADRDEDLPIPRSKIIGKSIRDAGFSEDSLKLILAHIKKAFATGETQILECELAVPKGPGFYEIRIVPLNEDEVLALVRDITRCKRAEQAVKKRLVYEEALTYCSQVMLEIENLDHALISVIEELLSAIDVSRISIFKNFEDPVDGACMRLVHEAAAEGIQSLINSSLLKHYPYGGLSGHLLDNLLISDAYGGIVSDFPEAERNFFASQGISSVLIVPIRMTNNLWGFIALGDCVSERIWAREDTQLMQAVASMLGAAIERRQVSEQIEASLAEKEVLLKEIHHRVKNNLQVIASLFDLQTENIENEETLSVFKQSQDRLRSIALIHEKLYASGNLSHINLAEYIYSLSESLFVTYRVDEAAVELDIDAEEVFVDIGKAIPCSLIINELVSNALKHAFPEGRKGQIRIRLHSEEDKAALVVADDGVGLPEEFDIYGTKSLGLQLVTMLTEQLKGTIEFTGSGGAEFKITFPIEKPGKAY